MSTTDESRLPDTILPQHQSLLSGSAISPDVAAARGYRSVTKKTELRGLGFGDSQCRTPALLIPVWGVTGEIATYQARPDQPRINRDGKAVKYETPSGSRMALDVPPPVRIWLSDPTRPLVITEGARKADAAVSKGLCCIALLGVWNWRGTNDEGGKTVLPDWEHIALNGREVLVCFDSDVVAKLSVHVAMARLKAFLEQRKARVRIIYLPQGEGGAKTGLDDFLAAGHTVEDLMALACDELRALPRQNGEMEFAGPYRATANGLSWAKPTREGEVFVPLTNFRARIVGQVIEDDGVETRRLMEIEALLKGRPDSAIRLAVTANEFSSMNWVLQHLGAEAVVHAGFGTKEHVRTAIQLLSKEVTEHRVYAHTGWRQIGGVWSYLHAGGAIGPEGPVEGVEIRLPEALRHFVLRCPQDHTELQKAVSTSLRLLEIAPDHITFPLFAAVWRAAVDSADFAVHVAGPTGGGKSVTAALAQQHWGGDMDGRHLPGSWSSTGNALEGLAFAAKDVLLVVDDFAPTGASADVARIHREADRLLRAQGNSAGRLRMRADASLRPPRPPRGLILSTGEDVPRGESLRARLLVVELSPEMPRWEAISVCQRDAASGLYATAMAGFVQWVAGQRDRLISGAGAELAELRAAATSSGRHKRTPEIVANLALGLRYFLAFGQEVGALDAERVAELWQRGWKALGESAAAQAAHQASAEPTGRFIQLVRAAISGGRAHVADPEGGAPERAVVWGWRERDGDRYPQGTLAGWVDGDDLYLEPETSFAVAQGLARDMGDGLPIAPRTLHKRLHEKGLLASTEAGRSTLTVRRMLTGSRRAVLHMHARAIMPTGTDQTAHDEVEASAEAEAGQYRGQLPVAPPAQTAPPNCPETPVGGPAKPASPPVGGLGSREEGRDSGSAGASSTSLRAATTVPRPDRPCYSCRGTRFWRYADGAFVCAVCHSPARAEAVVEWFTLDGNGANP
jgi:hypothetical protein